MNSPLAAARHDRFWPLRVVVSLAFLCAVSACAPKPLAERPVHAASADTFADFRAKLGADFAAEQLKDFDTAVQELKLDAMNSGVAGVAAREEKVFAMMNGKSVREVEVLGWQARHRRLNAELADMEQRLAHDSALQAKAVSADSVKYFSNLINNEQDLVAQSKRNIADTEAKLQSWNAKP